MRYDSRNLKLNRYLVPTGAHAALNCSIICIEKIKLLTSYSRVT